MNASLSAVPPILSIEGDTFEPGQEPLVALGVRAIMFDLDKGIYIPWLAAEREGSGDVGRFLDSLPRDRRVVFPTVISNRLEGMLARRGFSYAEEWFEEMGENTSVLERGPKQLLLAGIVR